MGKKKTFKPTGILLYSSASFAEGNFTVGNTRTWTEFQPHYIVTNRGDVISFVPTTKEGKHSKDFDKSTIAICYMGGRDNKGIAKDTLNVLQQTAIEKLVEDLRERFGSDVELLLTPENSEFHPEFNTIEKFGLDYCDPAGKTLPVEDFEEDEEEADLHIECDSEEAE